MKMTIDREKIYSLEDVLLVAGNRATVMLTSDTISSVQHSFQESLHLQSKKVYSLTTGLGDLSEHTNVNENSQNNILLSHACGVGDYLEKDETRAVIFCRLINLAKGMSGVRPEILQFMTELLNKD